MSNHEDDISLFFTNKEVPQIFETPIEIELSSGGDDSFIDHFDDMSVSSKFEVKRSSSIFSARSLFPAYEQLHSQIDLEALLT